MPDTLVWLADAAVLALSATVLRRAATQAPATQCQPLLEAATVQMGLLGLALLGLAAASLSVAQ